jgi:hypothetical protein
MSLRFGDQLFAHVCYLRFEVHLQVGEFHRLYQFLYN